jgi:hypothetical protein
MYCREGATSRAEGLGGLGSRHAFCNPRLAQDGRVAHRACFGYAYGLSTWGGCILDERNCEYLWAFEVSYASESAKSHISGTCTLKCVALLSIVSSIQSLYKLHVVTRYQNFSYSLAQNHSSRYDGIEPWTLRTTTLQALDHIGQSTPICCMQAEPRCILVESWLPGLRQPHPSLKQCRRMLRRHCPACL